MQTATGKRIGILNRANRAEFPLLNTAYMWSALMTFKWLLILLKAGRHPVTGKFIGTYILYVWFDKMITSH